MTNISLQDVRQTKEYALFMKKMGWQVINTTITTSKTIKTIYIYIKKIPLFPFSVAKILRSKYLPSQQKLKELSKKHKIIFTKIQPFAKKTPEVDPPAGGPSETREGKPRGLKNLRLKTDHHPLIPTKTIWINLKKTEKTLLKEMGKKVRYSINFSKRKGVKAKIISGNKITKKQLNEFYKIWSKNKPHNWLFKPNFNELKYLVESFGNKCFFVFASTNHLISGVLILNSSNMAFDWFGASTGLGRKLLAKPLVLWKAIKESKKKGLKIFDLGGIYDQRFPKLNKGWKGFSYFKKGFGGKEIEFSQPLIRLLPSRT